MIALVTGANRGIGAEIVRQLAARGDHAIGTTRGSAPKEQFPGVEWHPLEVTDPVSVRALAHALGERPLDLLVCNAGIYRDRVEELENGYPPEMWAETMATNVTGVFLTVQALLPALRRAQGGRIAIVSSRMACSGKADGQSLAYRASKAAVLNLGLNLAAALKVDGIGVGVYHPGWVRTGLGGPASPLSPEESAAGLIARFDLLSPGHTGIFENWDGRANPV